jgi:uncharacterized protein YggU (UPF0235/DUF167 family)
MKIYVKAKTRAKRPGIEQVDETHYVVAVKELPRDGKANWAMTQALAHHLNVPRSCVHLIAGLKSKEKIFEITSQ